MTEAYKEEMEAVISSVVKEIREVGLLELRKAADQKNVKLTEELFRSFKAELLTEANDARQGIMLSFRLYGRFKDMKRQNTGNHHHTSNKGKKYGKANADHGLEDAPELVKGMHGMIKKLGLSKFKYLPGYTTNGSRRMPTTNMMMYRLAWTLAIDRLRKGQAWNKGVKGWYNKAKGSMTNKGAFITAEKISKMTAKLVSENLDGVEINI